MSVLSGAGTVFTIEGGHELYYLLPSDPTNGGQMVARRVSRSPQTGMFFSVFKRGGPMHWEQYTTYDDAVTHQAAIAFPDRLGIRYNRSAGN